MQMRWVQLMAIAIGKIIFLSYLLEKTGNIMHALNRLPGLAFFRKWRAAKCLFSLLLLSCAGISSTALAATIVFTVTDNSDAPNANATTPTTCVSTLGGTFAGACTLRAAIQAANYTLQTRSEEHTSELQSQSNLVCRLLLDKKHSRRPCSRCRIP